MYVFVKKVFHIGSLFLSSLLGTTSLSCISMNNQECKVRSKIISVNSNEPVFYPFNMKTSKYKGSCNNINNPYPKIGFPNVIKDLNDKVFNLMSRTNETSHIKWHEICKCKYRLDASVWNNKRRWNNDKCKCRGKELIEKGICNKGYIWNPSSCKFECDKSCDFGEYLDYEYCKCRKIFVDQLIEQCNENIEETSLIKINSVKCKSNSCILYIVLFINIFYNQYWNCYLFCLLEIHKS